VKQTKRLCKIRLSKKINKKKIIFLLGPTASGKTDLAIKLSKNFDLEIISVDSVMVYKDADIGSAKPSKKALAKYPHFLVNNKTLSEIYSVAEFCKDSYELIEKIHSRNNTPLFVGGSMMYFKSLLDGINEMPARDDIYREMLIQKNAIKPGYLFKLLLEIDPEYAKKIQPNDERRILRALEVVNSSGKTMTENLNKSSKNGLKNKYDILQIGIYEEDRAILHQRIKERLEVMLDEGLIEEVKSIRQSYSLPKNHPIFTAVNYNQVFDYLENHNNIDKLFNQALFASRQLAKRQITWIRSWEDLLLFNINSDKKIKETITNFLQMV
jgi:tRNA dimethylallyltransferase